MPQSARCLAVLFVTVVAANAAATEVVYCPLDPAQADLPPLAPTESCLPAWNVPADDCSCDCGWYGLVEALGLGRNNRTSRVAVIRVTDEGTALPGTVLRTTGDATFGFQPGVRALVGWRQDECRAYELSYFGIFNWHASTTVSGNNDLAIPGDLGLASLDFFAADQMTLRYQSRLHSAEANLIESAGSVSSLLAGFRYLTLNEDFNLRSTDLDTGTSNYAIHTTNNLFGGQAGARATQRLDRFGWDATAKAGIFGNAASQVQSVSDFPPGFFLRDRSFGSVGQVAFVGDINLSGYYYLNDLWSLRAGYNLLWIQGVALAPEQLDFTDTATSGTVIHAHGALFAHGINVGVAASW